MSTFILILLIAIGIFDLYLYFTDRKTLSQGWGLDKLGIKFDPPKWIKWAILVGLLVMTWWLFGGVKTFVRVLIGVILGHLLWNE